MSVVDAGMLLQGQREAEERVRSTKIACEARRVRADQEYQTMVTAARARLVAARNQADGMIATAEAEAAAAEKLKVKRKYELEWKRLQVMEDIAGTGRRVITGKSADAMLGQLVDSGLITRV